MTDKEKNNKYVIFIKDLFHPIPYLFGVIKSFYKNNYKVFIENKEATIVITYCTGLVLQAFFIFFLFGIEGIGYLSFTFSLTLLGILLFSFSIGIPAIILMIILAMFLVLGLWKFIIGLIGILLLIKFIFPNLFTKEKGDLVDEKIKKITLWNGILIIIVFSVSYIYEYGKSKPIEVILINDKNIVGDLKFHNQSYYFIENCGEKIVIPEKEISIVHYLCPNGGCTQNKLDEIDKLKKELCHKH